MKSNSIFPAADIIEVICDGIKRFTDVAIIGLSGGADSTLVACLCVDALGKGNVHGVHMPYNKHDETTFNHRSYRLALKLGIIQHYIPIKGIADSIVDAVERNHLGMSSLDKGNARARARMCVLYGITATRASLYPILRHRVIGTGNISEDFIGYDTKGGDALADIFPIGDLFKSEVYQLLDYYREKGVLTEDLIDRVPSAGLWDGQTDEGELGYTYNDMEHAIKYLKYGIIPCIPELKETTSITSTERFEEILEFVKKRHFANKHKHDASYVIPVRDKIQKSF